MLPFVVDPGEDGFFREHIASKQKIVILAERGQGCFEAGRDHCKFRMIGRGIIGVFLQRIARMDLVLNAIDGGHQYGGERQVWIAARVRATKLNTFRFRTGAERRNAASGGAAVL